METTVLTPDFSSTLFAAPAFVQPEDAAHVLSFDALFGALEAAKTPLDDDEEDEDEDDDDELDDDDEDDLEDDDDEDADLEDDDDDLEDDDDEDDEEDDDVEDDDPKPLRVKTRM